VKGAAALLLFLAACHRPGPAIIQQISWTQIVTLGADSGEGALTTFPAAVVRDREGRYIVSEGVAADLLPRVYDSAGHFIQVLGHTGDGPGEYRRPSVWFLSADSVVVTDEQQGQVTVLAPDYSVVRTFSAEAPHSAARLVNGDIIINAPYHRVRRPDWAPLMRYGAAGAERTAFGGDSGGCGRVCGVVGVRILAADPHSGFWSAWQARRLVLEHFDSTDARVKRFEPAAVWFPAMDSLPSSLDRKPFPLVSGLSFDSAGRLWILASIADPQWESGLGAPKPAERGSYRPVADVVKYRDGIIEVRDTVRGALIASTRLPDSPILLAIAPGVVGRLRRDEDGWTFIDVWQMRLQ
jgi:hypothetical protein